VVATSIQPVEFASECEPYVPLSEVFPDHPQLLNSAIRLPVLDGLRGIAILLVLLCHALFEMHPSSIFLSRLLTTGRLTWSGVDLFFVLSGFLIGGILLDSRDSPRYFKTFYMRRCCRILPLYTIMLLLFSLRFIVPNGLAGAFGKFSQTPIPWLSYATFTQNFWMAWNGTFGAGTLAATWSLAVEEQFYLTVPLVIRSIRKSTLTFFLLLVIGLVPLLRTAIYFSFAHGRFADYVLMPCRADALSMGVLAALLLRDRSFSGWLRTHPNTLKKITLCLFLGLIPLTVWGDAFSVPVITIGYSWLAMFYTGCLLIAVTSTSLSMQRALGNPVLLSFGTTAYCTYLLHLPMMEICRRLLGLWLPYETQAVQFAGGILGIVLTLMLAKVSWVFFERPLLRRGHSYKY
jgi:peptidoglycan/LPS O-acetylase OafA/YrhL